MKNLFTATVIRLVSLSIFLLACGTTVIPQPTGDLGQAPPFSLSDLHGNTVSMADYDGRFLVIHIATTWCPYCNAEAPYLEKLHKEYAQQNVGVLIIDVKEPRDMVLDKISTRFDLSFPVLLDSDGEVAASFAPPDVLPELARDEIMLAANILIDPQGDIQYMSLLDTRNFDAKLIHLKQKLNELLEAN